LRRFPLLDLGSVMPNNATHGRARHRMMARYMTYNAAHCRAFDTPVSTASNGQ
jgi:hypothetical protein